MADAGSILPLTLNDFPHVRKPQSQLLLGHWLDRRSGRVAPARPDIDPTAIADILPGIWVCDFLPAERRFRMRLAGEDVNQIYGYSIRNHYFEDIITPSMLPEVLRRYRRVVEEPAILLCSGQIYLASGRWVVGERLVLPLLGEGGALMHVIGASIFDVRFVDFGGPPKQEAMVETFTPLRRSQGGPAADERAASG